MDLYGWSKLSKPPVTPALDEQFWKDFNATKFSDDETSDDDETDIESDQGSDPDEPEILEQADDQVETLGFDEDSERSESESEHESDRDFIDSGTDSDEPSTSHLALAHQKRIEDENQIIQRSEFSFIIFIL